MESDNDPAAARDGASEKPRRSVWAWRKSNQAQRQAVLDQLFFEADERVPYLARFATLMSLASAIAAFGLISDSEAVVVGAMLIAPLMIPVLGFTAAMVMAWPSRLTEQGIIVGVASIGAVVIGWIAAPLFSPIAAQADTFVLSDAIVGRTEPNLIALAIAVAAGVAGAYVLLRPKAGGAIAGVAIAVSLVPPLTNVGILIRIGETSLAGSTVLLYLTNVAGIIVAAGAVFLLFGFVPESRKSQATGRIRLGISVSLVAVLILAIPLLWASIDSASTAVAETAVLEEVEDWVGDRSLEIVNVEVQDIDVKSGADEETTATKITVDVVGADRPGSSQELADQVAERLNQDVEVLIRVSPRTEELATSTARAGS